jgi:hypothetical protein
MDLFCRRNGLQVDFLKWEVPLCKSGWIIFSSVVYFPIVKWWTKSMTPWTGARGGAPWTRMAAMCTAHQHVALPSVEPHRDGLGRKRVVARFSSATDGIGRAVDWVAQQRWTVAVAEARQWHGWSAKDAKQRRDQV